MFRQGGMGGRGCGGGGGRGSVHGRSSGTTYGRHGPGLFFGRGSFFPTIGGVFFGGVVLQCFLLLLHVRFPFPQGFQGLLHFGRVLTDFVLDLGHFLVGRGRGLFGHGLGRGEGGVAAVWVVMPVIFE